MVDLERHEIVRTVPLGPMLDTFGLSANEKLLTVALRGTPAQVAIVDTDARLRHRHDRRHGNDRRPPADITDGHFTYAAFEVQGAGVAAIDHDRNSEVVQTLDYPGRPHGVDFARP